MGKKYLVVSDNHGSMANLEYVIDRFHGQIEGLIHCGDMEIPPEMLEELAGCPVYMAAGNCDYNFSRDKVDGNSQGYKLNLEGCEEDVPVSRAYAKEVKALIENRTKS